MINQKWPEMHAHQARVVGNAINGKDGLAYVLGKLEGAVVGDRVGTKDDGRVGVSDVRMQHLGEALHEVRIASEKGAKGSDKVGARGVFLVVLLMGSGEADFNAKHSRCHSHNLALREPDVIIRQGVEAAHPRSPGDGTAVRGVAQFCGAPKRRSTEHDAEELPVGKLPCASESFRPKANEKCLGKASIPALACTHHVYGKTLGRLNPQPEGDQKLVVG